MDEADDYLRCTVCAAETDVTASSLFERMGRTRKGTWRKRSGWMKLMAAIVSEWKCNDCLTRAENDNAAV